VDVSQEVVGCTEEGPERWLAVAPTGEVAVRRDDQFHQPGYRPVLTEQAAQDRLEVVAGLDRSQLAGAVPANLFRLPDGRLGHLSLRDSSLSA
jgi:hypothetical protein